jgi:hypothetical protein
MLTLNKVIKPKNLAPWQTELYTYYTVLRRGPNQPHYSPLFMNFESAADFMLFLVILRVLHLCYCILTWKFWMLLNPSFSRKWQSSRSRNQFLRTRNWLSHSTQSRLVQSNWQHKKTAKKTEILEDKQASKLTELSRCSSLKTIVSNLTLRCLVLRNIQKYLFWIHQLVSTTSSLILLTDIFSSRMRWFCVMCSQWEAGTNF